MTRFHCFAVLLPLFLVSVSVNGQIPADLAFENFLHNSFTKFPDWLIANDRDELAQNLTLDYSSKYINFNGSIPNQKLLNYSSVLVRPIVARSELKNRGFKISISLGNFIAVGNYSLDGSVFSSIPVVGSGRSEVRFGFESSQRSAAVTFDVYQYKETPDGFVDITRARIGSDATLYFHNQSFEGLNVGGYEDLVLQEVRQQVVAKTQYHLDQVTTELLTAFFIEVFEETPFSEIIGKTTTTTTMTPLPPITTTTTEKPCAINTDPGFPFGGKILDVEIIDKQHTIFDGKKGKLVTRIVSTFEED